MATTAVTLHLTELQNAAFCNAEGELTAESQLREVSRLLRSFADHLDNNQEYPVVLRDLNGNRVGSVSVMEI